MKLFKEIAAAALVGLSVVAPSMLTAQTMPFPPQSALPDLINGLRNTAGCLGVETAMTASGKQVVFAWFEDKRAVANWYYSDTHVKAMSLFGAAPSADGPLTQVTEDGPVLAIASVTVANPPKDTKTPMSISQVAIELYRPLPGGVAVGGRFSPSSLKVPGLREGLPPPIPGAR